MFSVAAIRERYARSLQSLRALRRDYAAVQDAAALESMRRIQRTFWVFGPIEVLLALWYLRYPVPADRPDLQAWAQGLLTLHVFTAAVTLVLTAVVRRFLRQPSGRTVQAIGLQAAMCITYLLYGVAVSYLDIRVGGVEAFILIACGVAGLSLMRPLLSVLIYGLTMGAVVVMLHAGLEDGAMRDIMFMNSLIAVVLSVVLSSIIFHQYARGLLLQRELAELAALDPLTQLPNRREVALRIDQALAKRDRTGHCGALLFIDLDHFKTINDTRGHQVGDRLLQQVAQRLRGCVRLTDTVARLGGDEFLVLLDDLSTDRAAASQEAQTVAHKCLEQLNQVYVIDGLELRSSPSIGIAMVHSPGLDTHELMRQADLAMYQAKDGGRNTLRFYDHSLQEALLEKTALENDLRQALGSGALSLHYQPQVDAHGQILGAEALLRWQHPTRGWVPPAQFIPVAEATGLMDLLGTWVLQQSCRTLRDWAAQPALRHLTLAVNVSALQFSQPHFVDTVLQALQVLQGAAPRLKLELTESMLVADVDDVVAKMAILHLHGVQFSLDDFGTGYSSLSYIKRLPLDQLKIDQSFVRDVMDDPNDAAIVRVIVGLSQSLGIGVIAEGVETAAQRDFLLASGCSNFQGYFFARPLPREAFEALLPMPAVA